MHMARSRVRLITVECAFAGKPFEVTRLHEPDHIRVRAAHPLWIKENLLNIGMRQAETPYVMWCDSDLSFADPEWVTKTIDALHDKDIIQPFDTLVFRGPQGEVQYEARSLAAMREHWYQPDDVKNIVNGGAWAMRTSTYAHMDGGLFEYCILGDADDIMGYSLYHDVQLRIRTGAHPIFVALAHKWQDAIQPINVGCLRGTIEHEFHGSVSRRQYKDRWKILHEHGFDPSADLIRNRDYVWQVTGKHQMVKAIEHYFKSRHEDDDN